MCAGGPPVVGGEAGGTNLVVGRLAAEPGEGAHRLLPAAAAGQVRRGVGQQQEGEQQQQGGGRAQPGEVVPGQR